MRRLFSPRLATGLFTRFTSTASDVTNVEQEVTAIRDKITTIEASHAANALVALYASRKMKQMDIRRSLRVFSDQSYHSPIFCHEHLPVILAHFIAGLDCLPDGLNAMPSMLAVRETLLASFKKLVDCDIPITPEQIKSFMAVLEEIDEAHVETDLLRSMAAGILELKIHISRHRKALVQLKSSSPRWGGIQLTDADVLPYEEVADIQGPLDFCNRCMIMYNFYSRMQTNLTEESTKSGRVGMVDLDMNLERVVRNAVDEAKEICTEHYGDCPDTSFVLSAAATAFRFPFMSTTIRYIVVELMKNACRATVEAHMKRNPIGIVTCVDMPPVTILINVKSGVKHGCICISDEGKGMTQEALEMAMAYSYTSVGEPALSISPEGQIKQAVEPSPLAGYGYGLPMSRVYARTFGGDLAIQTMEGFGTRAYFYIKLA